MQSPTSKSRWIWPICQLGFDSTRSIGHAFTGCGWNRWTHSTCQLYFTRPELFEFVESFLFRSTRLLLSLSEHKQVGFRFVFWRNRCSPKCLFFGWDWWDWLSIPTCWTTIHAQGTMTTYNFSKLTSPWFLPRILGVDRNASQEDIKKAYKKQVHVLRGSSFTCQVCRWCQGWGKIAKRRKVDLLEIFGGLGCYLKLNPGNKGPHRKVCWNIFNKDLKIQFWTFFTLRDLYGSRFWAPSFSVFLFLMKQLRLTKSSSILNLFATSTRASVLCKVWFTCLFSGVFAAVFAGSSTVESQQFACHGDVRFWNHRPTDCRNYMILIICSVS